MTEQEFRTKYEGLEKVKNIDEFVGLLNKACNEEHDYGSIVACCSLMMKAAFQLVNSHPTNGGITGFQASCLAWEMMREFGMFSKDSILEIRDYRNMLYPQYAHEFEQTISASAWERMQELAKKEYENLSNDPMVSPRVLAHMKKIADGTVPFGYKVRE